MKKTYSEEDEEAIQKFKEECQLIDETAEKILKAVLEFLPEEKRTYSIVQAVLNTTLELLDELKVTL